ncbi:hypothetical protein TWF694_010034 [Orbilia ellipsospora]|uniref:Transmembrane protein n=1 Tax=Orbilia ellipsospora TaxID=2528407 RepID=A0AAV9X8N9_9PEZI
MSGPNEVTHSVSGAAYPPVGKVVLTLLIMITLTALSVCFTQRILLITSWRKLTAVRWYILAIYADSFIFVFAVGLITLGLGVNEDQAHCSAAIIMCITCYVTTKRLVRNAWLPRRKDKFFLFNAIGLLVPYGAVCILSLIYRFAYFKDGVCRIGMKTFALIPLVVFDVVVNVYLTILFLVPVLKISKFTKSKSQTKNRGLRKVALKTFFGSCATLTSSVANLTTLMLLNGEPGWVCLIICNCDILFSAIVLHCITNHDHQTTGDTLPSASERYGSDETVLGTHNIATARSSFAKPNIRRGSGAPSVAFVGPSALTAFDDVDLEPVMEKPGDSDDSVPATGPRPSSRRSSKAFTFGRGSRNDSVGEITDIQLGNAEKSGQIEVRPRRVSMAVHVRPISEYAEYDSDGMDPGEEAIAEHNEVSDGKDGEADTSSEEDPTDRHGKYEERVPHKLV